LLISGLLHIGVYTKDVDKSIEFYTRILGFQKEWRGIVDHPSGRFDVALIKLGDCMIELVRPADLGRVADAPGPVQHIALKVSDLEKVMEVLRGKGIDFQNEGLETLTTFRNGIRHCFLYGPSGERIELAEEL